MHRTTVTCARFLSVLSAVAAMAAMAARFEDPSTRGYLVTALLKLVGQHGLKSTTAEDIIRSYRSSRMTDLQQRCYEPLEELKTSLCERFEQLRQSPALMRKASKHCKPVSESLKVLPYDASCEDIVVNKDSFMAAERGSDLALDANPPHGMVP